MPWNPNANGGKGRWINDAPRTRFTLKNALRALVAYQKARGRGESFEIAAKFAIYNHESATWHVRGGLDIQSESAAWRTNDRLDARPERLEMLLSNTFKKPISLLEIEKECEGRFDLSFCLDLFARLLKEKRDSKKLSRGEKRMFLALENYKRVMGSVVDEEHENRFLTKWVRTDDLFFWLQCRRGRDLFVLRRFDIAEAIAKYKRIYPSGAIATPGKLIVLGCKLDPALGGRFDWFFLDFDNVGWRGSHDRLFCEHIRRYKNIWSQEQYRARLDEFAMNAYDLEKGDLNRPPAIVLERLRRLREDRRLRADRRLGHVLDGPVLAVVEERQRERARRDALLKKWIEAPADEPFNTWGYPDATFDGIGLRVIRTKQELIETRDALENCAANYIAEAGEGESLMVRAEKKGKIIALGKMSLNETGKAKYNVWDQIAGPLNQRASEEIKNAYRSYMDANCPCDVALQS